MLIMLPPQEMSRVQNISLITIIANDILYNKLVQHISADLNFEVTKNAKALANVLFKSTKKINTYHLQLKAMLQKICLNCKKNSETMKTT